MKRSIYLAMALGAASYLTIAIATDDTAYAQATLPSVTVDAPRQARPAARPRPARTVQRATRARPVERSAPAPVAPQFTERGNGPVNGLVASRTYTGTKTDTPLNETPQSVSVIGREQIDTTGSRTVGEAIRYSPGVRELFSGADPRYDQLQFRGFNGSVNGYYLDGLQLLSTSGLTFRVEPFGLERIEVLRGPSSVLYGGANPGGLVNAVSKRPTDVPFGLATIGVNSFGNTYGAFDVGGPTNHPEWTYRVTGLGRVGGTQYDFGEDNRGFIAPAVTWRPNADTTLTVLSSIQYDKTTGVPFLPFVGTATRAPFGFIPTSFATSDKNEGGRYNGVIRKQAHVGYQFEHRFDDVFTVRQNARFSHGENETFSVIGAGYAAGSPTATVANLNRAAFLSLPTSNLFNVDTQLEAKFRTGWLSHTVLAGVDYKNVDFFEQQGLVNQRPISVLNPVYNQPLLAPPALNQLRNSTKQDQTGVYLQDQIKFDRFTLVLSGRNDFVSTNFTSLLNPAQSNRGSDSALSGRAGLIYTSAIGLSPYVSASRSFQPLVGFNSTTQGPLVPETGEMVEAGVKFQREGSRSYVTVAGFELTRQNFLTTNPTNALLVSQNGEAKSRGIEVEAVANLAPGLNLIGAYTKFNIRNTQNLNAALIGKDPTNTPEEYWSAFGDYTIQEGPLKGLGAGVGVRYTGAAFADAANTLQIPNYSVGDAVIHYETGPWRAQVNVFNFADRAYVATCPGAVQCFYGERRKVLGSLTYRW